MNRIMKKTIIAILMLACFCMASNPTHYFEDKWYRCDEWTIKPVVEKTPKCSDMSKGACVDYDAKGNAIHYKDSDGNEIWYKYDAKGNRIYENDTGDEWWYEYDANGNEIHRRSSDGVEGWTDYDTKNNIVHFKNSDGYERWDKWFFDKKKNKKYSCDVDENGNPTFED